MASTQRVSGSSAMAFLYDWDLNSDLTMITYPSGRVVNYGVDNAGRTNKSLHRRQHMPICHDCELGLSRRHLRLRAGWTVHANEVGEQSLGDSRVPYTGQTTYYRLGTQQVSGMCCSWDMILT